jgi:hypothetical protein
MKLILEQDWDPKGLSAEDNGMSRMYEVSPGIEDTVFVRIHSWDTYKYHEMFKSLEGKCIRVTIETIEDQSHA